MRFLILTQYYPPEVGAAQLRLAALARELQQLNHHVEVVTALPNYPSGMLRPSDRGRMIRRDSVDGIPVTRLWLYPATGAGTRRLLSYLSFTATGAVGALAADEPDVVFVESPPLFLGVSGWIAARRFRAAFVLNISDLWPDSVRDLGVMRDGPWISWAFALERWLYARATAVTAVTQGIRDRLAAKGVPPDRILFLPNGADTTTSHLDPAQPRTRPMFLYAGTHGLAHRLEVVLDAAELAPELDFLLVGDGTTKGQLVAEAERRRLTNVRFIDPVPPEALPALYSEASAGISTLRRASLMEGVRPAKVMAIMASGRPVLYSGAGEGAGLVKAAGAGIVVEPENPAALAAAARAIVADPDRAREMGANGRRYIEAHLSWTALVGTWLKQLEAISSVHDW